MAVPEPHCDLAAIDYARVLAGPEQIRAVLPHRHEMEMVTAVLRLDAENHIIVGYKDVSPDEFWVRGHFPGNPIMPGVLMCEAAAQLTCYYTLSVAIHKNVLIGLGGIENTRFRRAVLPGDRLLLVGKGIRVKPRLTLFNVQGYVRDELAFHTDVLGVVLGRREE